MSRGYVARLCREAMSEVVAGHKWCSRRVVSVRVRQLARGRVAAALVLCTKRGETAPTCCDGGDLRPEPPPACGVTHGLHARKGRTVFACTTARPSESRRCTVVIRVSSNKYKWKYSVPVG
eukprot:8855114-Pyramimonas_sp.AAC.1